MTKVESPSINRYNIFLERKDLNNEKEAYQRQLEVLRHAQKSSQTSVSSVDAPRLKSRVSSEGAILTSVLDLILRSGFPDKRRTNNERTQSRERRSMDPVPKRQPKADNIPPQGQPFKPPLEKKGSFIKIS